MKSIAAVTIATLLLCSHAYADHHKSTSKEEMVKRIVKYFPGKWEYKSGDGDTQGSADWSALAGGRSIGGPGKTENGSGFALAGWDPEKKIWLHIWHQDDGQFGRLEVQRFEGDTYYGELRVVEGDGSASEFKWENKIVDKDHFVITQRSGDDVTIIHWRRKK